ncbi:VOC family protein [Actinoplanes aureus]|uniref:VOC family protein n=1 Tax=Actinoplanes aureus TaxID=2792083 RepID=A0A931FZV6_9ACTN|nr:VOC family protein [Actinoplanes aureus]MBG0566083.1 VOC family protein [Actinoplanes aureus]
MPDERRIVYLFLYVRDLAVSRDFFERALRLRVLEEDDRSVKYDTGEVILALNRADDYGITLPDEHDHSTDIVFLVEDLDAARASLEERGVTFTETHRYEIGAITDFYDPDGHWFTLYETSEESLTWPSGDRIQAVRALYQADGKPGLAGPHGGPEFSLDGKPLIYLFLFVRDADEAAGVYADALSIRDIEGGPCSRASTADEEGVIKYDTGGVLLTTHSLETVRPEEEIIDHPCPPRTVNPREMGGKAVVFHAPDIEVAVKELAERGIRSPEGIVRSAIGATVRYADPSGHVYFLYEPSEEALRSPSGAKLRTILTRTY